MSQHQFIIDRDQAEMISDLLAWNLRHKVVSANGGDPYCEQLLNELCDLFGFGGNGPERAVSIELWATKVEDAVKDGECFPSETG